MVYSDPEAGTRTRWCCNAESGMSCQERIAFLENTIVMLLEKNEQLRQQLFAYSNLQPASPESTYRVAV